MQIQIALTQLKYSHTFKRYKKQVARLKLKVFFVLLYILILISISSGFSYIN